MKIVAFIKNTALAFLLLSISTMSAQGVFGKWKTIDENGIAKSIVKIYEENGELKGDVIRILKESERDNLCTECEGELKNKKIEGMTIIKNMVKKRDQFEGGTILDPENGKTYKAKIWLNEDNPNILNVRGYIGFLYRTQNWVRLQ